MGLEFIIEKYLQSPLLSQLGDFCVSNNSRIAIRGLFGSSPAFVVAALFRKSKSSHLVVMPDKESAAYFYNDVENILEEQDIKFFNKHVLFFPSSYKHPGNFEKIDNTSVLLRTETLNQWQKDSRNTIVVTYPDALFEKVMAPDFFEKKSIRFKRNEKISVDQVIELLAGLQFERTDFVIEPGQFAVRGGIIDVYSFSNDNPYRIELFGDEIESIRTFDTYTQLSVEMLDHVKIVPDARNQNIYNKRISLPEYLQSHVNVWFYDAPFTFEQIELVYPKAAEFLSYSNESGINPEVHEVFSDAATLKRLFLNHKIIEFGQHDLFADSPKIFHETKPQPSFNKNITLLLQQLENNAAQQVHNYIFSDTKSQSERIAQLLEDSHKSGNAQEALRCDILNHSIHQGFIDHALGICCFTDHEIFDRYHRFRLKENYNSKEAVTLKEIYNLQPGDYITHIDHGVGRYSGLEKIEVNGKLQEAIRLVYDNQDLLYVSIHSLHRISKYVGKEGIPPKLNKLGSAAWSNLKSKTKQHVKDIARELIKLYSERKASQGHAYPPDNYMQHELEASFIYQDTPDQVKVTADVKKDMETDCPMDRLVCGDVGFGKTEIAIRAAFKAVADSKQVAVLVPTTILAFQHFRTFSERLHEFPCKVEYLNRFKSAAQQKEVLKQVKEGKIDILIGTHRMLSKDVFFKNLGLLIIDEEQKFGVSSKEKIRTMKVNVDTLTLTATPIPRTLQFSLMGARDLSIINTPPPNRHPIQTELHVFNEASIRDAIQYEVSRGGQVFFVHNRIHNIQEIADLISKLVPGTRIAIGHGQMDGKTLEQIMLDFIEGQYDVLVSTTIVESGLDIPNANTIIINEAQNYGLSDLHQLRGRVGRNNRKAFCYLLGPPMSVLTEQARKRLKTIEEFSDLGSGFNIAMRDLDIRGAGDILGAQQSGFISEIGFEMYQKILDEALFELKQSEYSNSATELQNAEPIEFIKDCLIETDLEVLIPDHYISNISERLALYKELDNIEAEENLMAFEKMLTDRFGNVPPQTLELLDTIRLRRLAKKIGFEKIVLKEKLMKAYFIANQESGYFQSETFNLLLSFLKNNPGFCALKEVKGKLMLVITKIEEVKKALIKMQKIHASVADGL